MTILQMVDKLLEREASKIVLHEIKKEFRCKRLQIEKFKDNCKEIKFKEIQVVFVMLQKITVFEIDQFRSKTKISSNINNSKFQKPTYHL